MPDHGHVIVVPTHEDGLRQTAANAHRRYGSVVMDETHLLHAIAYVSLNPVRAGLVKHAQDRKWSSVHARLAGKDDAVTTVAPALSRIGNFARCLEQDRDGSDFEALRQAEIVGRPVGGQEFIEGLEKSFDRPLQRQRRGPKVKTD